MKINKYIYLLLALIIFLFPQNVRADAGKVFFYTVSDTENLEWVEREIELPSGLNTAEKAILIFDELFGGADILFVPEGVRALAADLSDECLSINVSGEILNYGGSYNEHCLRNQIIKTALGIPGVKKVSLKIENLRDLLAEGSVIFEETSWTEPDGI